MMNFVLKTRSCVFKTRNCVLKMIFFSVTWKGMWAVSRNDEFGIKCKEFCIKNEELCIKMKNLVFK